MLIRVFIIFNVIYTFIIIISMVDTVLDTHHRDRPILHTFVATPSASGPGVGLSRRSWIRLNRPRTGVGRFGANMLRWGLSKSEIDCGAEQTTDHITSGRCAIYRPPEGINGLIVVDENTGAWLENIALGVLVVSDGTRKKKTKKN